MPGQPQTQDVTLSAADLRLSLLQITFGFLPTERRKGRGRSPDVEVYRTMGWEARERMRGERGKMPMVSIASFEPGVHGSIKYVCVHYVCRLLMLFT
jgi:hypothetical protein